MADALISPEVGTALWAVGAVTAVYAAKKISKENDSKIVPLMGVVGAFVFAAQMLNFAIPMTGSSGHFGGGLLLAILLGPHAAFLTLFSVLGVQALFFADGGLLALGSNVFNMAFLPAYLIYPFVYKPLIEKIPNLRFVIIVFAALLGLQIGAFGVVVETLLSGITALPFTKFLILMQPIHLAIGLVEGVATALIVEYVLKASPNYFTANRPTKNALVKLVTSFTVLAIVCGGFISYLASSHPDGLEWSIGKTAGVEELDTPEKSIFTTAASVQERMAFLPDYNFSEASSFGEQFIPLGTGLSGIIGGLIVLLLSGATAILLVKRSRGQ